MIIMTFQLISTILVFAASEPSQKCRPSEDRYYVSDNEQCDKFYMCKDGELHAELQCEDGLVFDVISKQCGLPHGIDCSDRQLLQNPQPRGGCPRLNGKWAVEESCDQYIDCTSGVERLVTCQNHLVYDDESGQCQHADVANRDGCTAEKLFGFNCPSSKLTQRMYAAGDDCRAFFTCAVFTGYHPRLGGCPQGSVFNEAKQQCDAPENVPRCRDYYRTGSYSKPVQKRSLGYPEGAGMGSYFQGCYNGGGLNCGAGLVPCWEVCDCQPAAVGC